MEEPDNRSLDNRGRTERRNNVESVNNNQHTAILCISIDNLPLRGSQQTTQNTAKPNSIPCPNYAVSNLIVKTNTYIAV